MYTFRLIHFLTYINMAKKFETVNEKPILKLLKSNKQCKYKMGKYLLQIMKG